MTERNYKEESLRSNFAYKILATIYNEDSNYPSGVADELDSSYHSVRNYIKAFSQLGILVKGDKEGRKQKYQIDEEALLEKWFNLWKEQFHEIPKMGYEGTSLEEIRAEVPDQKFFLLPQLYLRNYFSKIKDSNLEKMLLDDFAISLTYWFYFEDMDAPEHIEGIVLGYVYPYLVSNQGVLPMKKSISGILPKEDKEKSDLFE